MQSEPCPGKHIKFNIVFIKRKGINGNLELNEGIDFLYIY
jgi:hypothetical protein